MDRRIDYRIAAAFFAFALGIAALASHILRGQIDTDYIFGCLSAVVFATYGWYCLRRESRLALERIALRTRS